MVQQTRTTMVQHTRVQLTRDKTDAIADIYAAEVDMVAISREVCSLVPRNRTLNSTAPHQAAVVTTRLVVVVSNSVLYGSVPELTFVFRSAVGVECE